jgi:MFS family permease
MSITGTKRISVIIASLIFVEISSGFLQGYYEPLIPQFGTILKVGDADLTLFNGIPLLVAGLFVPLLTKLGDITGHRLLLRIGILSILIGVLTAIVGAFSGSYWLVLLGRLLMGPIAIWLPLEIAIIHPRVDEATSRKAVGALVAAVTSGTVIGMVVAGIAGDWVKTNPTTTSLGIAVAAPAALLLVSLALVLFIIPKSEKAEHPILDFPGVLGLSLIMLLTIGAVTQLEKPGVPITFIALLLAVAAVGVGWYLWEKRVAVPAIDVRLVFSRRLGPLYLIALLQGFVLYGTLAPFSTFVTADPHTVGYGFTLGPWGVALIMAGNNILGIVGAVLFAPLVSRLGARVTLVLGTGIPLVGFGFWVFTSDSVVTLVAFVALGIGYGILAGGLPALTAQIAPRGYTAIATGLYNSLSTLGGAIGNFVMKAALSTATVSGIVAASGYKTVWGLACGAFVAALAAALIFSEPKRTSAISELNTPTLEHSESE